MPILKVLKSGETDIDSSDIWRFALHSDYPTFKIKESGSQSVTLLSGTSKITHTITHNLGYYPMFFASVKYGSYDYPIRGYGIDNAITGILDIYGDPTSILTYAYPYDTNNLGIGISSVPYEVGSNYSFTVSWAIMIDEN
jgi:hypothetical protein